MSMIDQARDVPGTNLGYVVSFEAFFRHASERVYRALYASIGDADLAEEAVAEAFTRAYARWDRVRGFGNPSGGYTESGVELGDELASTSSFS